MTELIYKGPGDVIEALSRKDRSRAGDAIALKPLDSRLRGNDEQKEARPALAFDPCLAGIDRKRAR